jgi:hypothetical protein
MEVAGLGAVVPVAVATVVVGMAAEEAILAEMTMLWCRHLIDLQSYHQSSNPDRLW